jgi:predicted MPP superfamily phosphohydrolase
MNRPNTNYTSYFSELKSEKFPPIYAVMGNHDVMWNTEIVKDISNKSSIKFLNNESIEINWIQLIWIIDKSLWWNLNINEIMDWVDLNNDSDLFSILLTHQPIWLEKLKNYPIDLEIAWHTHRGQFYWMRKVVEWMNDYAYWEYKLWDRTAFVTQWIWTWGLPFRLWTQSEMVIINLIKK